MLVRNKRFDVPFDDALSQMARPLGMISGEFMIFSDIDKMIDFSPLQSPLGLGNRTLIYPRPRGIHQLEESWIVLH